MIRRLIEMLKTHTKCDLCVFAKMSDYSEIFLDAQNLQKKVPFENESSVTRKRFRIYAKESLFPDRTDYIQF